MSESRRELDIRPNCSSGVVPLSVGNLAILSGLFLQNGAAVALGIVLTVGPAVVWLVLKRRAGAITLSQSAPEAALEGETVTVQVSLTNRGKGVVHHPRFVEIFAPEEHAQKVVPFPVRVRAGETVHASYRARCLLPRGVFRLGPAAIRVSDPLGWFDVQGRLESDRFLRVLPRPLDFGLLRLLAGGDSEHRTSERRRRRGESEELWSVRDYRPGDPPRSVHWSASARRGALVVREPARARGGDVALVLDLDRRGTGAGRRHGDFENMLRLASAVIGDARRRGLRLEVLAQEGRIGPAPAPEVTLRDWLETLLFLEPRARNGLGAVLAERRDAVERSGTLVVCLHAHARDDDSLMHELARLARGRRVVAVIFAAAGPLAPAWSHELRRRGVETLTVSSPREAPLETRP